MPNKSTCESINKKNIKLKCFKLFVNSAPKSMKIAVILQFLRKKKNSTWEILMISYFFVKNNL